MAAVLLRDSSPIYGRDYGPLWVCPRRPECDARVGCHPHTITPLGTLAREPLRRMRHAAHQSFDTLWRRKMRRDRCSKTAARRAAYAWLAARLDLQPEVCHIGLFTEEQCKSVIALCRPYNR